MWKGSPRGLTNLSVLENDRQTLTLGADTLVRYDAINCIVVDLTVESVIHLSDK